MANLNGRWKVAKTENAEAFIAAAGLPGDKVEKLRALVSNADTILEIQTDGSVFNRKTYVNGEMRQEQEGKVGEDYEREGVFGKVKIRVTYESANRVTCHQTGGLGTSDIDFTVDGDRMTYNWTLNGATLVRSFTKA